MTDPRNIVIKGDGLAAAMTAAYLGRMLPRQYYHIVCFSDAKSLKDDISFAILHSDIREFNRLLKIKEVDFLRHCDGVFSLGERVTDELGHDYLNTFCPYGLSINGISFMAALQKSGAYGALSDWEDCNLAAKMARTGKFLPPDPKGRPVIGDYSYGYQINPALYRDLLLKQAKAFGVSVQEKSEFKKTDSDTAFLIIDCGQPDFTGQLTESHDSRMANHVHHHISDNVVTSTFNFQSQQYEMTAPKEGAFLPSEAQIQNKVWRGKTLYLSEIPIFLPFLGAPSRLIQIALERFLDLFPSGTKMEAEQTQFNYSLSRVFSCFANYQSILLASSGFKALSIKTLSEEARFKIRLFSARGRLAILEDDTLFQDHWVSMLLGQGFWPKGLNLMSKNLSDKRINEFRENYAQIVSKALGQMPGTSDFIQKTCPSAVHSPSRQKL